MKRKQPDAFEKTVHRPESWHDEQSMYSIERWAATLLRTHHKKIVRMVLNIKNVTVSQFRTGVEAAAYRQACDDILSKLKRMKGKK